MLFQKTIEMAISYREGCFAEYGIQIANTPNELVEMDFADYGDFATFLRIQGTFSRFSAIIFMGEKER